MIKDKVEELSPTIQEMFQGIFKVEINQTSPGTLVITRDNKPVHLTPEQLEIIKFNINLIVYEGDTDKSGAEEVRGSD